MKKLFWSGSFDTGVRNSLWNHLGWSCGKRGGSYCCWFTGVAGGDWLCGRLSGTTWSGTPKRCDSFQSLPCNFGQNAKQTAELNFDQHEELVTELYPVSDLKGMVRKEITHSIGLNSILMFLLKT